MMVIYQNFSGLSIGLPNPGNYLLFTYFTLPAKAHCLASFFYHQLGRDNTVKPSFWLRSVRRGALVEVVNRCTTTNRYSWRVAFVCCCGAVVKVTWICVDLAGLGDMRVAIRIRRRESVRRERCDNGGEGWKVWVRCGEDWRGFVGSAEICGRAT